MDNAYHSIDDGLLVLSKLVKNLCHDLIQLSGAKLGRGTGGSAPVAVDPALPDLLFPQRTFPHLAVEAGTVLLADDLAAVRVAVVIAGAIGTGLALSTALFIEGVGSVPQFLGYDGRDGRIGVHDPFALVQKDLPLGTIVHGLGHIGTVPAFVFGIAENMPNGQDIKGVALSAGVSLIIEDLRDGPHAKALVCVEVEDAADNDRLLLVDSAQYACRQYTLRLGAGSNALTHAFWYIDTEGYCSAQTNQS